MEFLKFIGVALLGLVGVIGFLKHLVEIAPAQQMHVQVRHLETRDQETRARRVERAGLPSLNEGDRLEFDIEVDRRGKYAAVNLQPIS